MERGNASPAILHSSFILMSTYCTYKSTLHRTSK